MISIGNAMQSVRDDNDDQIGHDESVHGVHRCRSVHDVRDDEFEKVLGDILVSLLDEQTTQIVEQETPCREQ